MDKPVGEGEGLLPSALGSALGKFPLPLPPSSSFSSSFSVGVVKGDDSCALGSELADALGNALGKELCVFNGQFSVTISFGLAW
ncbi:unnamed protein product [marine sediment metagenome]|uniref:Uncharacterized protein n=1 Tax=marine sediment metagenome TaxID=412755 RepID=X1UF38_9ZZZZ